MIDVPHWVQWHERYEDPGSGLSRRLRLVRGHVADAFDAAPPGPVRVLSLCAGEGRDLLDVLPGHSRRDDVTATLVELEPALADAARATVTAAGLDSVTVRTADASNTANVADAVPADVLLLCGIFGNVSDDDVHRCVDHAATLCAPGATVIWTRHRRAPDLTPSIRAWFTAAGFDEVAFGVPEGNVWAGVGVHRLAGAPRPFVTGTRLFTFVGDDA